MFKERTYTVSTHPYQPLIEILGIKISASEKDIKKAYFVLAKKYHPDLNPDTSARLQFEKVQKAYETLSDTHKRHEYDNKNGFARMEGSF
jgi:DnaJ-class molecular chaperone